jgi:glucose/arabinose dehydrogenase
VSGRHGRRRALATATVGLLAVGVAAACSYTEEPETEDTLPSEVDSSTTSPDAAPPTGTDELPIPDLAEVSIGLEEIAELDNPVAMAARSGDPAIYVAEQEGRVQRIAITTSRGGSTGSGATTTTSVEFEVEDDVALDIRNDVVGQGEQGLIGLTFSTDGSRMYIAYTGLDERQYLEELEFPVDEVEADESTRRLLLVVDDAFPNHNGGQLAFGPDGFLYWGMGDGGGAGDPELTGQDPTDLLGSVLRIDPDLDPDIDEDDPAFQPYAIPNGNPFADGAGGAPEVWAFGLRNPWRFSFDRQTGDLWVGDVGQDTVEEINLLRADGGANAGRGANMGWPVMEGDRPFAGSEPPVGSTQPIFTYGRDGGACSVIGGYVYRGLRIEELQGAYLFTDFCAGRLRALTQSAGTLVADGDLGVEVPSPTSFGEDAEGELYVLSQTGSVFRVVSTAE